MSFQRTILSALVIALFWRVVVPLALKDHPGESEPEIEETTQRPMKRKFSSRSPASISGQKPGRETNLNSTFTVKDRSLPDVFEPSDRGVIDSGPVEETNVVQVQDDTITNHGIYSPSLSAIAPSRKGTTSTTSNSLNQIPNQPFGGPAFSNSQLGSGQNRAPSADSGSSSSDSSALNCLASVGDGTFNAPISVSLSCSSVASIKYCLSETTCCDPSSGSTYISSIPVGADQKTYCLSFEGETSDGTISGTISRMYTFNELLPDIQTAYPKIFYQTTQLGMVAKVSSNDFGKANHFAGIINLQTRDPGISGDNLSCDEIVTNHASFVSPSSIVSMASTDVSPLSPASEIEAMLTTPEIAYGQNYLTSYIWDANEDLRSCSTTMVTLEDFPFFVSDDLHGETGTNFVREFSGGFTSVGFFEDATTVSRGPAGSSIEDNTSEELRTGLFGVFY